MNWFDKMLVELNKGLSNVFGFEQVPDEVAIEYMHEYLIGLLLIMLLMIIIGTTYHWLNKKENEN